MAFAVLLYTPEDVDTSALRRAWEPLGVEWAAADDGTARYTSGPRHVWISTGLPEYGLLPPGTVDRVTAMLGGPAGLETGLRLSTYRGAYAVDPAVRLISTLAESTRVAVFGRKTVFDAADLPRRAAGGATGTALLT